MSSTAPVPDNDDDAGTAALAALVAAVAEARADPRAIPHEEMQVWLLRLAAGELDAPPPAPRLL
jgi:hypothetical protein